MSLLWRERIRVALAPGAVHAVRDAERRHAAGAWPEALQQVLAGWQRADVTIVASNRLVRYALVPRARDISGEQEEIEYARHHFARVHGARAREWHVRYSPQTGLASAIDASLLGQLRKFFDGRKGVRLVSFQPYLMAAFNCVRARLPKEGAWLVLPEAEATCIALFARGAWAGVSVTRDQASLERERLRMGSADAPRRVFTPEDAGGYAMALSAA